MSGRSGTLFHGITPKTAKSRQDKHRGGGGREAETVQRNSVGKLESHLGKAGHPRKRVLRRRQ